MLGFRKSKKGFTLIELMVVVAIIGVLALLGLRLYTTQQAKAKEAIVKANASTVHTIIQSEMADSNVNLTAAGVNALLGATGSLLTANLRNPFTATAMGAGDYVVNAVATAADVLHEGDIHIRLVEDANGTAVDLANAIHVEVQGYGEDGDPIPEVLTARR